MEENDSIERIRSCMLMESACAAVFHLLAMNFPRASDLWNQIAMDEEAHAEIIARGMRFKEPEDFTDFEVPPRLEYIRKTMEYAADFKKMVVKDTVSLRRAFDMVISLLQLKNESYRNDLIAKEEDYRLKRVFQKLYEIDGANYDLVAAAMNKYIDVNEPGL
jgi:hypothetical protein